MAVFGISMMRDEADICAATVSHMLTQVDEVIVADNLSDDGTGDILRELGVTVLVDPEPGYLQSVKMTRLAALAAERDADWVVPFDADEVWYSPSGTISEVLNRAAPQWLACSATLYDHVATGADPLVDDPTVRMGWRRRTPAELPKVACRTRPDCVIEQGNHGATYDGGTTILDGQLIVRHFPYRSAEQMIRKARNGAAAYAATDLPHDQGAHWRSYGRILSNDGDEALADVFRRWFWVADPQADKTLVFDPVRVESAA